MSESTLVNTFRQKNTFTENGAITHSTSLNANLDLFFISGACRNKTVEEIENYLYNAINEDIETALKIVFWAGDVREGAGERRFFKIALNFIEQQLPLTFKKNISNVPFYNRWDSLFQFHNNEDVLSYVSENLNKNDALLAKWMPREGKANNQKFRTSFCKYTKLTPRQYRKRLITISNTIEQKLSSKRFNEVKYKEVPSVAFNKYRTSFYRNDEKRFTHFLDSVKKGESTINAGAIFPHDIYRSSERFRNNLESVDLQWESLPNYLEGSDERILPVCDVSPSMNGLPMDISISLGIYLSERNVSMFKDAFITFSGNPQMQYLNGETFSQKTGQLKRADWGMTTDLNKTFAMILQKGIENNISNEEMPTMILIISDMEFDKASDTSTNYEAIRTAYETHGYTLPKLVFWNVDSRNSNVPVSKNDQGVALVSGASPSIIKSVLNGSINPEKVMEDTINNSRYNRIEV